VAAAAATVAGSPQPSAVRSVAGTAQGTTYSLQWSGDAAAEVAVATAATAELERIDALLSNYRSDSVLERFNATASTETQPLPTELVTLLRLAQTVHAASAGCFDPTVRPLVHAWGFDTDDPAEPAPQDLAAARAAVGLDKLEIVDAEHVRKTEASLAVDMSSIGQGYTAARLADLLEGFGVTNYLAEIGGEIVARGTKPDGTRWRVGVENPGDDAPGPALELPADRRSAVVTSGTYRHYFDVDGRRFSHILDPRTGFPVEHDLVAVTVVAGDGATAAAWGTALLCLGPKAALDTATRERVAAFLWVRTDNGLRLERTNALETDWADALERVPR
jgi:thiamine biosynthesis lipoprotein